MRAYIRRWWAGDPLVVACPACGCPIQGSLSGSIQAGMEAHFGTVHPEDTPPTLAEQVTS